MTSNWSTYTPSTEGKGITSLRIRRALRLGNLRVYAAETRWHESLEQREVRLETDRMHTTQACSSESSGQWETKSIK